MSMMYLSFHGIPRKHIPAFIWIEKGFAPKWNVGEVFRDEFDLFAFKNAPRFGVSQEIAVTLCKVLESLPESDDGKYSIMIFTTNGLRKSVKLSEDSVKSLADFADKHQVEGHEILLQWTHKGNTP